METIDHLPQYRLVRTEIPGPRSRQLMARRSAAIPSGVGTTLGIFVTRAAGGIVEDVVGNSAPRVVEAVSEQAARFTHTCFQVTPYEGYVEVCELLNRLTPGDHPKR